MLVAPFINPTLSVSFGHLLQSTFGVFRHLYFITTSQNYY